MTGKKYIVGRFWNTVTVLAMVLCAWSLGGMAACDWGQCQSDDSQWGSWGNDLPEGAIMVDEQAYGEMLLDSHFQQITPEGQAAAREREAARDAEAQSLVDGYLAEHPEFEQRWNFEPPSGVERMSDGNYLAKMDDGQEVVLMGKRSLVRDVAATIRAMGDADSRLRFLRIIYPHMPPECRSQIASPSAWEGMDAKELVQATDDLTDCWVAGWGEVQADIPMESPLIVTLQDLVSEADQRSSDTNVNCYSEKDGTYLKPKTAMKYCSFKKYVSNVRDQGKRGSCVAFATASAMEYKIARMFSLRTNLSEQAIYALGKAWMYHEPDKDGLTTTDFLHDLRDLGWALPFEPIWPYNPAPNRGDDDESFKNVCKGYDFSAENYKCSETSHESSTYCTNINGVPHCIMWSPGYMNGYSVNTAQVISGFEDDDFNEVKAALYSGAAVVLSVSDTETFQGNNSAYFQLGKNDQSDELGGHALHALGYIGASGLDAMDPTKGWILVKNSWGCSWGDRGYSWLPTEWVRAHFRSIVIISPQREGLNNSPVVEITAPESPISLPYGDFFPDPVTFEARADDIEDGEDCCTFEWYSNIDGYMGQGKSLQYVFVSPGHHSVKVIATDSEGGKSYDTIQVELTNQAPTVQIVAPPVPDRGIRRWVYRGVTTMFVGEASDPNQPLGIPCGAYQWSSSNVADDIPTGACAVPLRFDTVGDRDITLQVSDHHGETASITAPVTVVEPPEGMNPQVLITDPHDGNAFPVEGIIMLTAAVDNPGGQVLTYEWAWRPAGSSDDFIPISVHREHMWYLLPDMPSDCGTHDIELRFTASNGVDTFSDSVVVGIVSHPC